MHCPPPPPYLLLSLAFLIFFASRCCLFVALVQSSAFLLSALVASEFDGSLAGAGVRGGKGTKGDSRLQIRSWDIGSLRGKSIE